VSPYLDASVICLLYPFNVSLIGDMLADMCVSFEDEFFRGGQAVPQQCVVQALKASFEERVSLTYNM
jgi:hypothetical protein